MENENDSELDDKNISNSECAFQLDYSNQSLKENKKFQKWKIQMLKKYGNDAKLFKCKNDNCYFYGSNKEAKLILMAQLIAQNVVDQFVIIA